MKYLLIFLLSVGAVAQTSLLPRFSEREVVALVLLQEARGEQKEFFGMASVAQIIQNRMQSDLFPTDAMKVIFQPGQFACFRKFKTTREYDVLLRSKEGKTAMKYASLVLSRMITIDPRLTREHLFYMVVPRDPKDGKNPPIGPGAVLIGNHVFYPKR